MEQLEQTQILPKAKCMGRTANIANILIFNCSNGETTFMFHLNNLPRGT